VRRSERQARAFVRHNAFDPHAPLLEVLKGSFKRGGCGLAELSSATEVRARPDASSIAPNEPRGSFASASSGDPVLQRKDLRK
jgi:hypothetical protein